MICGEIKPGTYNASAGIPVCELDRGHRGMHRAEKQYDTFLEDGYQLKTVYQWSGAVEIVSAR